MSRCFGLCLAVVLFAAPRAHAESNGKVLCEITENGVAASGVISVQLNGKEIATGSCGRELSLAAGKYTAALRLDGALDGPEQRQPLSIKVGELTRPHADF